MATIKLFEFEPTRSSKCRWALMEAELDYESIGNSPEIIGSDDLLKVHTLGKLPAAVIDGKPLFESFSHRHAIADLAPGQDLIAKPGTWDRTLHVHMPNLDAYLDRMYAREHCTLSQPN